MRERRLDARATTNFANLYPPCIVGESPRSARRSSRTTLRALMFYYGAFMFPFVSAAFAFVFGSIIGSFLNVVIHRVPLGQSVVHPGSQCPTCGYKIRWYDNIPILSWLMLGGECRKCSTKISARYAAVEGLMGMLSAMLWFKLMPPLLERAGHWSLIDPQQLIVPFLLYFFFLSVCVVLAFIDLEHMIVPHEITLPSILIGIAAPFVLEALFTPRELIAMWPPITPSIAIIGAIVGALSVLGVFVLYFMARGIPGMGGGDVTLMALCGAWLGWPAVLFIFFAASIQGIIAFVGAQALGIDFGTDANEILAEDELAAQQREEEKRKAKAAKEGAKNGGIAADQEREEAASAETEGGAPEAPQPKEAGEPPTDKEATAEDARGDAGEDGTVAPSDDEEGPIAIPFGPFIILAALEHFFLGPIMPSFLSMLDMYM